MCQIKWDCMHVKVNFSLFILQYFGPEKGPLCIYLFWLVLCLFALPIDDCLLPPRQARKAHQVHHVLPGIEIMTLSSSPITKYLYITIRSYLRSSCEVWDPAVPLICWVSCLYPSLPSFYLSDMWRELYIPSSRGTIPQYSVPVTLSCHTLIRITSSSEHIISLLLLTLSKSKLNLFLRL